MTIATDCWRCEQPGHIAAECRPPPAATRKELLGRIDRLKERWISGGITLAQKRQWIEAEHRAWKASRK